MFRMNKWPTLSPFLPHHHLLLHPIRNYNARYRQKGSLQGLLQGCCCPCFKVSCGHAPHLGRHDQGLPPLSSPLASPRTYSSLRNASRSILKMRAPASLAPPSRRYLLSPPPHLPHPLTRFCSLLNQSITSISIPLQPASSIAPSQPATKRASSSFPKVIILIPPSSPCPHQRF